MSVKRVGRFFYKAPYKYVTQADVKDLSVKEIANILPDEVDAKLKWIDGGVELTEGQKRAVLFLCQLKKTMRANPQTNRTLLIRNFINSEKTRQIISDSAGPLIAQTTEEVDLDNAEKLRKTLPTAPSNTPILWPTVPNGHVHVGGKWKKTKTKTKTKTKSRRTKTKTKSRRTKTKTKSRRKR